MVPSDQALCRSNIKLDNSSRGSNKTRPLFPLQSCRNLKQCLLCPMPPWDKNCQLNRHANYTRRGSKLNWTIISTFNKIYTKPAISPNWSEINCYARASVQKYLCLSSNPTALCLQLTEYREQPVTSSCSYIIQATLTTDSEYSSKAYCHHSSIIHSADLGIGSWSSLRRFS
jgi:hypothetical protein